MICPICKKPPKNDNLYGWYKGNLFIIKAFKCCGETFTVGEPGHIKRFSYNTKEEDYFEAFDKVWAPMVKFDHMRLLVGNANVCRGGQY